MVTLEKKINIKALILSLVFALTSCGLIIHYINTLKRPVEVTQKVPILVATRNIEPGGLISQADLNAIDIAEEDMPAGILNHREQIEGMYAKAPILAGEPFRNERLSTKQALSLSCNIPEGMRAVSIFVNEDSIFSNQLGVGDRVDVIGSFTKEWVEGKTMASSMIIIQNAEVLAVGSSRFESGMGQNESNGQQENLPRTVTLAVTPEDSEKLVFTTDYGDFTLALRGRGDETVTHTPGITIDDVTPERFIDLPDVNIEAEAWN
jgi:Flp pilus assembly protein CpaB